MTPKPTIPPARTPAVGTTPAALSPSALRSRLWVLGAPVLALAATCVLVVAGAGPDWIGAAWLIAALWMIAASFVQALWSGLRHGDWSAFMCEGCCTPQVLERNDEDLDYSSRTGRYAYLRIGAQHEVLMREGERLPVNPGHPDSLS